MRLLTTLLLLCTFFLPGQASQVEYTFNRANKVEVKFFPTKIVKGSRRFITITCPSWAVNKFDVKTRDGVLYIGFNNKGSNNKLNTYEFNVTIETPEPFTEISTSVGASVEIQTPYPSTSNLTVNTSVGSKASLSNVRVRSLKASCSVGSGMTLNNISASGSIDLEASTSGNLVISGVKTPDLNIEATVSSIVSASGIDAGSVRVDAGVQSKVSLFGRCDNFTADANGYGTTLNNHLAVKNKSVSTSTSKSSGSSRSYSSASSSSYSYGTSAGRSSSKSSSRASSKSSSRSSSKSSSRSTSKSTKERYRVGNGNVYIYDETTDPEVTVQSGKTRVNITSGSKSGAKNSRSVSRSSSSGSNNTYIEVYSNDNDNYNQNQDTHRYRDLKWTSMALSGDIDVVFTVTDSRSDVIVHGNAAVSTPYGLLTVKGNRNGGSYGSERQLVEIKGPVPTSITLTDGARLEVKNSITLGHQFTLSAFGSSEANFTSIDAPAIVIDARETSTVRIENQISNGWSDSNKNGSSKNNTIWIALDDASRIEAGSLIGRSVEITAEGSSDAEVKAIAADLTTVTAVASGQINIEDVRADLLTYDIDSTSTVYIRKAVLGKAAGDNDGTLTFVSRQITGKSNASNYVNKNPRATTRSRTTQHPSRPGTSRPANRSTSTQTTTSRGTRILP